MSVVTAVKYLAAFATEALRPWDPSRELASRLLADLPLMQKLRADDEATADEVTHLVLIQFGPDEPPSVDGLDYLVPRSGAPREFLDAHGCTWRENGEWLTLLDANGNDSGLNKTPAFVGSHYGPLVEVQPDVPVCSLTAAGVVHEGHEWRTASGAWVPCDGFKPDAEAVTP